MRSAAVLRRRRRQGGPIAALRSELGDAAIAGLYVMGSGQSTTGGVLDSWADARGAGFGPTLSAAGSARPAVDADGIVTFDGTDDYLRATDGALANITAGSAAIVLIGTIPTYVASNVHAAILSTGTTVHTRTLRTSAVSYRGYAGASAFGAIDPSALTGVRVIHARRTQSGGNAVPGIRAGSAAEATAAASAVAVTTPDRFTVGASAADVATEFGAMVVRAIVVYNGDYASGTQYESVNRFGASLGATI